MMNATKAHTKGTRSHHDVEEDDELEEVGSRQRPCQSCLHSKKGRHANVGLRAIAVEANATSVVEERSKNATTGGDDAYDITKGASWIDTAGGATHPVRSKGHHSYRR
jgi:hypothetical protein